MFNLSGFGLFFSWEVFFTITVLLKHCIARWEETEFQQPDIHQDLNFVLTVEITGVLEHGVIML